MSAAIPCPPQPRELLGQRLVVELADGEVFAARLVEVTPSQEYVCLVVGNAIGPGRWLRRDAVKAVEVLPEEEGAP